jgi:hypothetical protein
MIKDNHNISMSPSLHAFFKYAEIEPIWTKKKSLALMYNLLEISSKHVEIEALSNFIVFHLQFT